MVENPGKEHDEAFGRLLCPPVQLVELVDERRVFRGKRAQTVFDERRIDRCGDAFTAHVGDDDERTVRVKRKDVRTPLM